jgi:hypothetical protein
VTNPFAAHGIDHLSPSSCALFAASPGAFVLQYLFKARGHVGAAAHRGTAVEAGVALGLVTGADLEQCQSHALAEFDRLTAMLGDSRRDKERDAVPKMVAQAFGELTPYGPPSATQRKVVMTFDGLAVPIVGYDDFEWDNHGVLLDLKTVHALPSTIRTAHARQVAFYVAATNSNFDPRVTYVTPSKVATYRVEEPQRHVADLVRIAATIQRFVAVSSDRAELAGLVVPDLDSFYFNDPLVRQRAFEVWGI